MKGGKSCLILRMLQKEGSTSGARGGAKGCVVLVCV